MKNYLLLLLFCLSVSISVYSQCDDGRSFTKFDWTPLDTNEWPSSNDNDGDFQTYTIDYVNSDTGITENVEVTLTISDPNGVNVDDNFNCAFGNGNCDDGSNTLDLSTETGGNYGDPYLTWGQSTTSASSSTGSTFTFSFSRPVRLNNFTIGDIDDDGRENNGNNAQSYQDAVSLTASNGGTNIPLQLTGGSNINISGQTATAIYVNGVNGNVSPDANAGTLQVSSNGELTSFSINYYNGASDADGNSNGHAIRISGFSVCAVNPPLNSEIGITKSSSANGGPVYPGDVITYTIEVTNNAGASGSAREVTLTDVLPSGVNYVSGSAEKTYFFDQSQGLETGSFTHSFTGGEPDGCFGPSAPIFQTYSVENTDVPSNATLTNFSYSATVQTADWLSDISLTTDWPTNNINIPAGSFGGDNAGTGSVSGSSAASGIALGTYNFEWNDSTNGPNIGTCGQDNVVVSSSFTIDYEYEEFIRSQTTDAANAPPNLVTAADAIKLRPGETMTVTYQVTVDEPLSSSITELTNSATADSDSDDPVTASVTDDVNHPATISGTVEDTDGNPINGVTVELQDGTGNVVNDVDGNPLSAITDMNGNYSFTNVIPGDYVIVETDNAGYDSSSDSDNVNDGVNDTDNNPDTNDNQIPVSVVSGETDTGNDFVDFITVLPVDLVYFNAEAQGNNALLTWGTQSETNNSHFVLYRSVDGVNFEEIQQVEGAGTTNQAQSYSVVDENAAAYADAVYYKLEQVDFDGTVDDDIDIQLVRFSGSAVVKVYPNPAQKGADIQVEATDIFTIDVFAVNGQMTAKFEFGGVDLATISTSELAVGTYVLIINQTIERKIVVQ